MDQIQPIIRASERVLAIGALIYLAKRLHEEGPKALLVKSSIAALRMVPGGEGIIQGESDAMLEDIRKQLDEAGAGIPPFTLYILHLSNSEISV